MQFFNMRLHPPSHHYSNFESLLYQVTEKQCSDNKSVSFWQRLKDNKLWSTDLNHLSNIPANLILENKWISLGFELSIRKEESRFL